jgi:ribonuclease P protein component
MEFGRLLVVTPRKAGNACQRNLIRRRLKSGFYEEKLFEKRKLFVVFVYKEAVDLSFDEIKSFLSSGVEGKSRA